MGNWGRRRKESRISIYKSKAPADNGTLRRGTTSDERKARPCWRFHCPAWWSNSQENMQINYLQRLTRKLRLAARCRHPYCGLPAVNHREFEGRSEERRVGKERR